MTYRVGDEVTVRAPSSPRNGVNGIVIYRHTYGMPGRFDYSVRLRNTPGTWRYNENQLTRASGRFES